MIENISTWAEQVIIAVIIGTILEMILPKGNSKKYIKTVIGIYILYIIISPVITLGSGQDLEIDYSVYEGYFKNSQEHKELEKNFNLVTNNSVENTYKEEIKKQLKKDIENLGFYSSNILFEINLETGEIRNLVISASKDKKESYSNTISINKVDIGYTKKERNNDLSRQNQCLVGISPLAIATKLVKRDSDANLL